MPDITESHMRILKRAENPFYPVNIQELRIVRELVSEGLLINEVGRYRLSDDGLKYITKHGIDGAEHFRPVT